MAGDKFDQLYNALKADGAVSGTREHFRQFVYAPGKQGYHNRKQLYDALHADGAVSSSSYEEFARRLGLHAVNPKAQQPRTATTSGTDYMQNWRLMLMRDDQMNPIQRAQVSNWRERMQRAQEQSARQEQQRATPISRSRITPTAKNFNEMMQQLSTPEAKRARAKQQREDDARAFARYEVEGYKFVRNDGRSKGILGNDLLNLVDFSMNEAQKLTRQQYQQNLDKKGGIYAPQLVKEQVFRDAQTQELVNRRNVLMKNLSKKIGEIYSQKGMQRHIAESAEKLNMSVKEYVGKYVTPEIMNYTQKALTMRNQEEIMPHGALGYIAKKLSNSIIGMVVAPSVMSRDTRQRLQEGIAIADGDAKIQKVAGHKDKTYRSGIGTRFASTAVNMAADSGPLAVIGAGASAAVKAGTRVLTNGLVKAGVMKAAQKLTARQMAFKVANMTTAQKIMSGLGTRTATGALNLAGYSGVTAALNQASTGDDTSLQAIGKAGLKGAKHGAVTGAMFGVSGAIMSPWVSKFGITGMEKSTGERLLHGAQKFGATAAGLGVEAGTMMVADNVTGDKDISFGTWLEDVVMVGAFKAGEPSNFVKMGNILHHLTHNSGGNFVIGKNANGSPIAVDIRLTPDEKNELISSASGKNLMDAFVKVDRASKTAPRDPKYKTAYTDFMNDPDVSQSTKENVNAAMGLFNTTRGKSYRSVNDVKNKQILEYTKNGTLLTRTSYKNADERRAILYKQKLYRDNDDMMSLMGYARMKDMQFIDDDGTVTNLAFRFLKENGYDENKDITDPNNARLINDLRNQKSALYLDWVKYADKNGLLGYLRSESKGYTNNFMASIKELLGKEGSIVIDIDKIMRKDPMKRTDEENRIFYHVKRALEDELFPSWRPHADQSASQGKTVAEEHSLGTDNPDSGVVVDELRNLRNAEQALDAAMDSNDMFKQTFEQLHQQGLTPAQIYDALIHHGLTQEELTPLAQYINANARVQGMQQATADAIEENVKSFISDWSYHGTLNGQPMNGEQALYVQDSNGRTLLVGSGDVVFDQTTGRAKEGSGDMLVCLDPNTKEMVYVKAGEVTLLQNQPIDQFAAEYRQRLQMKNSEPYNQAAQEQAMQDAAKPQPKEQEAPQDSTTKEGDLTKDNTTLTKVDTTSGEDNTTNENLAPQEQPQPSRKFADGSDVPMATDSKGRSTPDYASMTPEQSAEILTEDFGDNAEKVVDGQIKKAENALKDAEKMKVDYTAEPNDIMEQENLKNQTIEAAKKQLDHAQNIKKAMTAKKVAETVGKTEQTEGAHEAGSVAAQKFVNAPRLVGNKCTRMLPDGETKIKGHYEIVPAESLTPSHDVNNDYKKSEGFPTDAEGRTVNDRDYEHDKAAQQNTDQIARKYNGMAIGQVPVVSDEGIVYDGNGRTMAGQKAAKEGTDAEYINDLLENAENFGFTREQIEQSGIEHPRLVLVTDERLPYDAATFAKFNRNEKKTQSNTEQAVAKAKTLTSDEVGAIVAEIEGNGSLDAFFNNSKAINDLVKTLVDKGIIGQNEVAQMMDNPERLSAQGREYVKNLLLGSIFKPETIRMLGIDSTVKNKAINAIRSVMDNMKLGDYSLRDEIDQAIQLLYEARQGGNKVDTLLRTPSMFGEDAAKRYPSISQMMALALEGKVSDFRDLLDEYNRIAAARNTGEGSIFEAAPTKEELVKEFLDFKIRYRDGEQRMSLKEWADYYEKTSPKHQENLVGDSKTAEERKMAEKKFIDVVNLQLGFKHKFNGIVELRKIAERVGLKDIKDTDLQELAEIAIVKRARDIASSESTNDAVKFERIKTLYENQPSLNQRDSERVMKQQYSTPAPYAFLADMYVKGKGKVIDSALEPSAGNGMLTIGLPMDKVHVNDIDAQRLANLRRQGFKNVTSQDGTQPFKVKPVDIVITNPPFGSATTRDYDGYKISSLEGQMAINALESMKGDGRAAIIIGGNTEYAKNGSLKPKDKAFLGYLYSHYNVEDVINVDGGLYTKQGTSYPTRIILINGRRLNENAFPPVKDKARAETVKDYDELYKRIEDDILRGERMDSSIGGETRSAQPELDKQGAAGTPKERVRTGEQGGSKPDGKRESDLFDSTSVSGTHDDLENQRGTEPRQDGGLSDGDSRADGTGSEPSPSKEPTTGTNEQRGNGSGGAGRNDAQPSTDEPANAGSGSGPRGQLQRVDKSVRGLSTEKVTYTPKSGNSFTLKAVMPADQQEAVNKNLEKLGDADQFLVDELGYNDKDDLYSHLAAEQVDSVALALQQAKKGNAFIIGDMTGIGKGRQAASLIRYAKKQGQVPVYFTKTAGLLSDVYRDLVDIGSPDLRPFVFGSDKEAAITNSDGNVVFALPSKSEVKRVLDYIEKNGKLPDEYDYVLTTYSQVSNGVYEFDEDGNRKERKLAKGKSFGAAALSGQKRRDAIEKLMGNAYLILDESHTAGGNSGQGNYFQHIIQKAKNVTFFSATFAKRPDNMPIYALRTAMNEGGMKSSDLIDAVKRGGATLQEIMSQTLTQCGQMIRRERDMTGVTIDWKAIDDPERVQEQREQYDSIIGLFNDIINFQKKYVSSYVDERNDELAAIQSTMGIKKGTAALGIKNQPFASKAFNTVQQVLLSLKAKSAAERAIDYLKQGMKPVIALNNTNESQTGNLALGEEMDAPDLGTSLKKGLEGTLRYTQKDAKDNSESGYIKLSDLGDEAVEAYHELEKKIEQTSTGLSLSPIDVIKNELQKAGYKVGELTGRQTEFVYNNNGTVTKVKRADTDKKKLARDFNDGKIDALILNKSAATGISLHASSKYKDQKKRVMIVAQQQLDVNDEVQMRGRIDRTGQVARGAYEYVVSLIPAEQRLLMMFKAKLKSLDANTTSSQKSKFNEMEVADITNKYGDKVVREYMAEHLDLYARMADPFGWEKSNGDDLSRIDPQSLVASGGGDGDGEAGADASKLLGRMALLRVSEQEKMLQEIGELYANEIQRLNEMGENDLEITELPLKAKTLHKEVWKQGAEPGGDNAFADNTYIEKVNMAILKKPMKASEVKASQDGLTGGKTWDEYKTEKKAAVKEYFDQKIADETQKYEERAVKAATKAKEKYIKDGKKGQKDSGMSDEQIEKMAGYQYDNIYKQEKDKLNDVVKNLKAKAEMFERVLDTFDTNQTFVLPTDMNNPNELSGFGNSYGRLIDIKITDNYSPNASSVSFATLDGRRKITFPIVGKVGAGEGNIDVISAIDNMTKQAISMGDSHLRVLNQNFDNWDRLTRNESRKNGYIVTGNLMQALVDSKDQGLGGQLVKYTTDTGEVKTGILMPDRFDPKGLTTDAPINSVTEKFELSSWHGGIDEVTSSDGEVKVKRIDNNRGNFYELRVPKSKTKGGKYFMDEDLLKLVNGNNFETRGNNMLAEFKPEQLKPVLDRLSKMGVKVQEERNTSEDEGTHFREDRGLQYSKTDTKDVKNSRIIPEDVDKNVSSQIEKRFDDEVERLYGDSSEKPNIEKEANKYATKQYIDTFKYDKKGNPIQKYEGLKSVIDSLDSKLKDIEQRYGFNRKSDINEIKSAIGTETTEGNDSRGMGGVSQGDSVRISGRKGVLSDYKETALSLAAAQRAKEYLLERFNNIRLKYGLEEGDWASKEQVERIFNDYNSDTDVKKIFDRIEGLVDVLGTKLKGEAYKKVNTEGYYYHPKNYILIDTDFLSSIQFGKQELASTICHEMLHVVTSDIINLYRKGYGDLLTESQRKAAKEVVDLYDEIKSYFDKHIGGTEPYALTNPAEMITELANPEWRKIAAQIPAQKGWFRRAFNAIKKMLGFHVDTTTDLDRLDKALENVIRNLDYGVFQKGAELNDEIVNKKASIPVSSHITQLSEKTGAKVNMVSSVDEIINKAAKAAIEEGRKITGWYDEKTGEVHLYMPNIHDRYTAEKTIWHEVVGHKGMRELFGDERFDKFLREVWYDLDKPENAALKKLVDEERKFNPMNIYDAIEEGIARLAEDGKGEPGFWNGIKNKVSDFLHEIGYRVAPNTKDVKYLLWLSKNLQKNPNDPYWKLRAEAVKYRLDHERMPAVVAHDGMFYGNDGKVRSMDNLTKSEWDEATDGQIHFRTTPSAGTALDRYHRSLDEHGYMFTESYMDNMLSLKKLMNAIVPDKKIEDIASSVNPYILQNTMQGAMSDAAQMFERNVMKPLDKAMADVLDAFDGKKDDEKIRNFNLYMITKHGLERNREFFVRDFLKKMMMDEQKKQDADFLKNSYYSDKEYLDNELKDGNIDLKEYYRQLDESIRNHFDADFEAGEHDYSGMHAIQEVAKSSDPYNDSEAIQSVMDSEAKMESIKKGAVKDYWDKVKAATQYSIDSDYKNGIISKELQVHVSNMFNWYVPLRKYDEATAEDTYGYITEQGDPKSYIGRTIMRARGHKYLSETNVLAQIGAMGNRAIKNGGMNAIRQAFARFARFARSNNLITETSVWYEKDPVANIVYERYPDIPEDATADEINQIVSDFNKDMKMKESQDMAYKVYRRGKIGYKFQRAENKSQHIVDVKFAGRTYIFIINGNPRAAQALNGLLENSDAKGIMKPLSSISRMMAQLCTSYNPEFVIRNFMRDAEFASSNVTSKEGARYGALWAKYYAQLGLYKGASNISFKDLSGTTGLGLFAKYRNGTLDMSDKVQRYFKEFMENGGETGWIQIKNMQDWTKEYKKDVKGERSKIDKGGAVLRDFFFGNLDNINEVAENIARFATYCASRDSNRSIIRSVYDAKEVSTNFNRHGSGDAIKSFKNGEMTGGKAAARWTYGFTASYLRHCSMFFNAGIQSTNLLVKNLKNHPVGTSINMLAIPFALGALAALGNNVLIASEDEKDRKGAKDPYGELPDYVRRNNLCIYKGGGQFIIIPLAIELRAFYGLGDLAAGLTFSPNVSGQKNPALDAVGCMSQLVPVMDYLGNSSAGKEPLNETIKAISPSALSPFVEWELNTDWKGAPIERRGDWNENSPAWQRAYRGVPDGYMAVNKWVNAQTNDVAKGNENILGNSFLDMVTNPSMLNHYIGGIGGGAATFTERVIGVIKHGKDTETKDIPFLRSLLYTPSEQSSLQRTKSKWYNYKDEMEKIMAGVDRLKSKNVPIDERITNIGEYFHFQNSKEAAKVRVIELAEKQMEQWRELRDRSSDTESINFANQNIDRIMMDAVDELDRLE